MTAARLAPLLTLSLLACSGPPGPSAEAGPDPRWAHESGTLRPGASAGARIGPGGGRLTSPGGRVELEVPPGAVAADTDFTVTEAVLVAADGSERPVFDLGPSGLAFPAGREPVLTYHLTAKDLRQAPARQLAVRFLDEGRTWWQLGAARVDAAAGTVSARLPHFTPYAVAPACRLSPADGYAVLVSDTALLQASCDAAPPAEEAGQPVTASEVRAAPYALAIEARVNGILGGDDYLGRVREAGPGGFEYAAPGASPNDGSVTVSFAVTARDPAGNEAFTTTLERRLKVIERAWEAEFTWVRKAVCSDNGPEVASYRYQVKRRFAFDLERLASKGEEPVYAMVAQPQEPTQKISFGQLASCNPYLGWAKPDGSGDGVSITDVTGYYLREGDLLEFFASIHLQDIPPFRLANVAEPYGEKGEMPYGPYAVAGLEEGAVGGWTTMQPSGTELGAYFTLHQRAR